MGNRRAATLGWRVIPCALVFTAGIDAAPAQVAASPPASHIVAPRTIYVDGEAVRSTIDGGDLSAENRYYEDFRISLNAGDVVQIDMTAASRNATGTGEFDTFLELRRPDEEQPLEANDDSGGTLNSRIIYSPRVAGTYVIRASGYFNGTGNYSLAVRRLPAGRPPIALTSNRLEGELDAQSAVSAEGGAPLRYQDYFFEGNQGERVQIDTSATNFTPQLRLAGEGSAPQASGIFSLGRAARIVAVLPRQGRYVLRLGGAADQSGHYTLALTRAPMPPPEVPRPLPRGTPVAGVLGLGSGIMTRGADSSDVDYFYQTYILSMRAGETIVVALDSQDFDPMLEAGGLTVLGFAAALSNDDSVGLNSRLEIRPDRSGPIYIRARSLSGRIGQGRFTLTATPSPPQVRAARAAARRAPAP